MKKQIKLSVFILLIIAMPNSAFALISKSAFMAETSSGSASISDANNCETSLSCNDENKTPISISYNAVDCKHPTEDEVNELKKDIKNADSKCPAGSYLPCLGHASLDCKNKNADVIRSIVISLTPPNCQLTNVQVNKAFKQCPAGTVTPCKMAIPCKNAFETLKTAYAEFNAIDCQNLTKDEQTKEQASIAAAYKQCPVGTIIPCAEGGYIDCKDKNGKTLKKINIPYATPGCLKPTLEQLEDFYKKCPPGTVTDEYGEQKMGLGETIFVDVVANVAQMKTFDLLIHAAKISIKKLFPEKNPAEETGPEIEEEAEKLGNIEEKSVQTATKDGTIDVVDDATKNVIKSISEQTGNLIEKQAGEEVEEKTLQTVEEKELENAGVDVAEDGAVDGATEEAVNTAVEQVLTQIAEETAMDIIAV